MTEVHISLRGLVAALGCAALFSLQIFAAAESAKIPVKKYVPPAVPIDSPAYRKYAPDRKVDVVHLRVDVTPDFKQRTLAAQATLTFKPIAKPLAELRLDAVELTIESVTATEKLQAYQATDQQVILTFDPPVPVDRETRVTLAYHCQPDQGVYFRTPEMGYKPEDMHLFTQGESETTRNWIPCYDFPNERFTSEIICRVPAGMTVLSNGRLISEEKDAATGLVAVRWLQDKPHVSYLISLVAGYFKKVEDRYRDVPLAFYTPASEINEAPNSFSGTKDIMAFFEQEIGVPYPWAKYYQVCVQDFVAGGMENTSITTLTDGTLFTAATENVRTSQGLVAHEMAHQWFGDLVTCKDWSHAWLNEGFATYYEALYNGHKNGPDEMRYEMYHNAKVFIDQPLEEDLRPTITRKYDNPEELFGYLIYPKGAWILHMLRAQLGEDLFRRCIQTYLERHQYGTVVTGDLSAVIEELSGRSWDQFFDQWAYHAHHPELAVSYAWDEPTKLAKLTVKQTQKISEDVVLFNFPLKVRFTGKTGRVERQVTVKEKEADFYFPLAAAPEMVRLDPDYELLAKINFSVPNAMLFAQLADTSDVIGRILALEQLAKQKDHETVAKLKHTLNQDRFYGVRIEAAHALGAIHTDEALEALLTSPRQSDARVRKEVVVACDGFYRDSAYAATRATLAQEKNPDIVAQAIRALGGFSQPEVRALLLEYLNSTSFRQVLADAAISAIRSQDDPSYLVPLREVLAKREKEFLSGSVTQALETLAYLARHEAAKDDVREFITGYLNHPREKIRRAALAALGTLRDPRAIAVLEKFATAGKDSPERTAAERSIAELRAADKPADDFKNLRGEVLELQKNQRDLRKELDDLKKKLDARPSPQVPPKRTPKPSPFLKTPQ